MSGAAIIYPPGGNFSDIAPSGLVNVFDTLEVTYTSLWDALNLTLFCHANDVPSDYAVWQAPNNPMAASGTYRLQSIYSLNFNIYQFPTLCHFKMTQPGNNDIAHDAEYFQLVSVPGTSTTYRSAVATTTSQVPALGTLISTTKSSTSTISTSTSLSVTASSTSSTTTSQPVSQEVGLSTAARAGICIGVGVIILVIAALCFLVFRLRKKINKSAQEDVQRLKPELPAYTASQGRKSEYIHSTHEMEHRSRAELPN